MTATSTSTSTSTSTINVDRLRQVALAIENEPHLFMSGGVEGYNYPTGVCGWTKRLFISRKDLGGPPFPMVDSRVLCEKALGLSLDQSVRLFAMYWPQAWFVAVGAWEDPRIRDPNRDHSQDEDGYKSRSPTAEEAILILRGIANGVIIL